MLGEAAQLGVTAGALQPPPDDAGVEHVPVLDAEDHEAPGRLIATQVALPVTPVTAAVPWMSSLNVHN